MRALRLLGIKELEGFWGLAFGLPQWLGKGSTQLIRTALLLIPTTLSSSLLAILLSLLTRTKNSSYGWPDCMGLRVGQEGQNIGSRV